MSPREMKLCKIHGIYFFIFESKEIFIVILIIVIDFAVKRRNIFLKEKNGYGNI